MRNNKGQFKKGNKPWNTGNGEATSGSRNPFYGKRHSDEAKEKNRLAHLGLIPWIKGKEHLAVRGDKNPAKRPEVREILSEKAKKRIYISLRGELPNCEVCGCKLSSYTARVCFANRFKFYSGPRHYAWNPNREEVKRNERNDPEYKQWRMKVWIRDNFKCRIANQDCDGRIEAHHILGWSEYVELRYEVNNGITLCHAHHPKRRAEEKRLVPEFQELVSASNGQFAK